MGKLPWNIYYYEQKNYQINKLVFESIYNILTKDNLFDLNIETIITFEETLLLKAVKNFCKSKGNFICRKEYIY